MNTVSLGVLALAASSLLSLLLVLYVPLISKLPGSVLAIFFAREAADWKGCYPREELLRLFWYVLESLEGGRRIEPVSVGPRAVVYP